MTRQSSSSAATYLHLWWLALALALALVLPSIIVSARMVTNIAAVVAAQSLSWSCCCFCFVPSRNLRLVGGSSRLHRPSCRTYSFGGASSPLVSSSSSSASSERHGEMPPLATTMTSPPQTSQGGGGPQNSNSKAARPTPTMPSQLFQQLAQSQLELLASSLTVKAATTATTTMTGSSSSSQGASGPSSQRPSMSKIKSMALYLPQENALTGQLEFLPAVLYPHPDTDGRVFIAGDSESKFAPSLPRTLTKLPGFAVAQSLLPGYPMVSSSSATDVGVGAVEEVFCHVPTGKGRNGKGGGGGAALSVPLLSGSQTVGVLLVSPSDDALSQNPEEESSMNRSEDDDNDSEGENWPPVVSVWTESDRMQVARAAKSLSLALSMDTERLALQRHNQYVKEALSESLHQIKNPLQALRTYGKLLQQRIAEADAAPLSPPLSPSYVRSATSLSSSSSSNQLLELADHLLVQSDRLSQRLQPVDWIVDSMDDSNDGTNKPPLLLLRPAEERSLVRWTAASSDKAGAGSSLALTESATFPSASSTLNSDRISDSDRNGDSQLTSKDQPLTDDATVAHRSPASRLFLMPSPEMEMSFPEDVLEPVLSAFRAIAADRDIQFEVDASDDDDVPGVTVSSQAVQEAVSNLLDNAFKYVMAVVPSEGSRAPRKPRVRVRIRPNPSKQSATAGAGAGGATAAAGATILIEDNGPGITDSELELVWKRGYRGESAIRSGADGSGLGLYIARSLVEGMGGTLRVLSQREASRLGCLPGTAVEVVLFRDPPASAQRS